MKPELLVIGAGGHARAVVDVIELAGSHAVAGFVVHPSEGGAGPYGYPVLGSDDDLARLVGRYASAIVGIGQLRDPEPRMRAYATLQRAGFATPSIVSPRAYVSPRAEIGPGTIVMHGAIVNAGAIVGSNCIVNSQSLIEHDAVIGDHAHVSTGARVNGACRVGSGTFLGSGSVVREGVKIGERCFVRMGELVLADLEAGTSHRRSAVS